MIELHGWDNSTDIELREPESILLNPRYIVSLYYNWSRERTMVICLSSAQYFLVESYETVKAILTSGRIEI